MGIAPAGTGQDLTSLPYSVLTNASEVGGRKRVDDVTQVCDWPLLAQGYVCCGGLTYTGVPVHDEEVKTLTLYPPAVHETDWYIGAPPPLEDWGMHCFGKGLGRLP